MLCLSLSRGLDGQVDPEWLKMWNEAIETIPLEVDSESRIASVDEAGIPFDIIGTLYNPDGTLAKNVILHAYHRDELGYDFGKGDEATTTWRLQGWAKTDANGAFVFHTIRPAADHLGREGAHIHFTIISETYGNQWAPTVFLADDPNVTFSQHDRSKQLGKFGWVCEVVKMKDQQTMTVNLKLREEGDF